MVKFKIKKGDKIRVRSGSFKGKEGTVRKVLLRSGEVLVSGIGLVKKHLKPKGDNKGGIVEIERPINLSKVGIVCSFCQRPVKLGFKLEQGKKIRFCRSCKNTL